MSDLGERWDAVHKELPHKATMRMTVYHGTGSCSLDAILAGKATLRSKPHLRKVHFSTTYVPEIARLFAIRKTPIGDFTKGLVTGVVIEFLLDGQEGRDFVRMRDPVCILEENEIAVFNLRSLTPTGVWNNKDGKWVRTPWNE